MEQILLQLFIFLTAAAIGVPLAKKLGLGSVLGYLVAGIIIGPFGVSLIRDVETIMHFTEFGVVMLLFLVGLELKPSLLWKMRTPIIGMGGAQVIVTALLIGSVSFIYLPWKEAVAVGLVLSLSSTAIVLQTLREKGILDTAPGRSIFSVLLFQDLAVIPILAILPLLATYSIKGDVDHSSHLFDMATLPGYQQIYITILSILFIFFLGKFASRPIFRTAAATHIREIFVATALAIVVGISLLMTFVGLSPALGTFLAGVVLADNEYRHELESDIEPFKGLLLGIFFISIGASLNFVLIRDNILLIAGITSALIAIKILILFLISFSFKMAKRERALFTIALAQGGEFAFVLFQFCKTNGVLETKTIDPFIAAVAISMFLTPLFFKGYELICKGNQDSEGDGREADKISNKCQKVIIAGFGRVGTDVGRFLISVGIKPVILDHDAANVDVLRKFGFEVYYGDANRLDLLEAAGAREASLIIIAISNFNKAKELIELVQKHYPDLKIAVSAADRTSAYNLMDLGVTKIRRETFGSALALGRDALQILGYGAYDAYRLMRMFKKHDEGNMKELYKHHRKDMEGYISMYQKQHKDLEDLMKLDENLDKEEFDKAWTAQNPERKN